MKLSKWNETKLGEMSENIMEWTETGPYETNVSEKQKLLNAYVWRGKEKECDTSEREGE